MESSTKILRRMLDERGVEYEVDDGKTVSVTRWKAYGEWVSFIEYDTNETRFCTDMWRCTPEQAIAATLGPKVTGNTSDGYHTFNELYHHRAVLFSVIVRDHRELAWKSMRHHDGTMYDGMFIVGIETPEGQATYHYDIDPYWDMFNCKELDQAPEWDGHTPSEAIERIATLGATDAKPTQEESSETCHDKNGFDVTFGFECTVCGAMTDGYMLSPADTGHYKQFNFCPMCGRRIEQ